MGNVTKRARRLWPVIAATVLGAALVVVSWVAGAGAESIALELGAGLVLVAVVYILEERLRAAVNEQIERVDTRIQGLERESQESPRRAFVESTEALHGGLVHAFRIEPSIETLAAIVRRLKELRLSPPTNLYPSSECLMNVVPSETGLRVKIMPNGQGAKRRHEQPVLTWDDGESYSMFMSKLGESWLASGLYPGHDAFERFDFAGQLAGVFADRFNDVERPE